ncbi:MAG TPA: hypothetical protein VGR64_00810, partial [Terracidiphilus sp.]|nr:hypothetical protein [Terracidiphilus sp.]
MEDVFWIAGQPATGLAVVLRPQGDGWLRDEIARFRRSGLDILVSMLESSEAIALGLEREGEFARALGMDFVSHPIPDTHIPGDEESFRAFVSGLAERLRAGRRLGVHCRGSIGRA